MVKRVVLIGQPNVGKSTLLNALTDTHVWTSNYPGTTVEVTHARKRINGVEYEFIDTPGIYNLYPSSLEEEVTEKVILQEEYDFIILVIDATAIERGLVMAISLAELGVPMIIAVNFWEEAARKGIVIDYKGLEKDIGIPVVKINPLKRDGLKELISRLNDAKKISFQIKYDDHIEEAINNSIKCLEKHRIKYSKRGLAVRLVEGDPLVHNMYRCDDAEKARKKLIDAGHDPYNDIEITRSGYALSIARKRVLVEPRSPISFSRLDTVLVNKPLLGLLASVTLVLIMLFATIILGNTVMNIIDLVLSSKIEAITESLGKTGLDGLMLSTSIEALYAQYMAAVPYVFIFYFLLIALEDSGLLARMIIWLHGFTKRIGLHSKGIVPILLGMGCSVPATRATRILPSINQRMVAIAAIAFVPCSSRASIIFGVAGRSLGPLAPIAIYMIGFVLAIIVAKIVSSIIKTNKEAILIEDIPPLRPPRLTSIGIKAWLKLKDFLFIVTPLIILGAIIYSVIVYYQIDTIIIKPLDPIAKILNLPSTLMIPLVYGFIQKDLVISMLAAVLGTTDFTQLLTPHQIMTFTMASTYQAPCIIALGMMIKELGLRKGITLWLGVDIIGFIITIIFANL